MRIFSNDSRQSSGEQAGLDEYPERVQSEPVAVPAQRPGASSPWAASPGTLSDRADETSRDEASRNDDFIHNEPADREARDGTDDGHHANLDDDRPGGADLTGADSGDRAPFHEPAAQPTAFGAGTVGGAVAASALAASVPPQDKLPGTVAAPELGPLFSGPDAQFFRDRWRDVQLQFVDDPKGAADDAATLLDEAVDALAASLRSQKQQLNATVEDSMSDTEQLRMQLRGYRDFLDRLLGL